MPQCQFIYLRTRGDHVEGGQCEAAAKYSENTLCKRHRNIWRERQTRPDLTLVEVPVQMPDSSILDDGDPDCGFPRKCSKDELRAWVNEARTRTDPMKCWRRGCIVCGRSTADLEMMNVTIGDLIALRGLLKDMLPSFVQGVDSTFLQYKGILSAVDGLPIDQNGLLSADEAVQGAPVIGKGCKVCCIAIKKGIIPEHALGYRLWTGIEAETPLSELTWIEEKLVARVHVSVQIQKCRSFIAASADGFHPQRQVKGHILTYPMEPATVLRRLPLCPSQLVGLVKVVFLSRHKMQHSDANRLRFYLVRREKVDKALRWLIDNNPHYHDVLVDDIVMARLPEEGIPEEVYGNLTVIAKVKEDARGHSRYDAPDEGTLLLFYSSTFSFGNNLKMQTLRAKKKKMQMPTTWR